MAELSAGELARINDLIGIPPGGEVASTGPAALVTAEELGAWIGITANRCHALGRDGVLPRQLDKRFPLKASVVAYCAHARELAKGKQVDEDLAAAKLSLAEANARKVELQNAKAEGELVSAAEVEREWADVLRTLRAAFLALPSRAASRLGHLTPHDLAALDAEVRDVLLELAEGGGNA